MMLLLFCRNKHYYQRVMNMVQNPELNQMVMKLLRNILHWYVRTYAKYRIAGKFCFPNLQNFIHAIAYVYMYDGPVPNRHQH